MTVQMKRLENLNLMDQFLFDRAMEDQEISRLMLEIILGKENLQLRVAETEKELKPSEYLRGIRLDLFAVDADDSSVYNTELQKKNTQNLPRRSRFYNAVIDSSLLDPGEISFNRLPDCCLIFIMPFDLFAKGKYCYTFDMQCKEITQLPLEDGATRIFLNTKGQNRDEVRPELAELLHYMQDTTQSCARQCCGKIRDIHERIEKLKSSEEMGVKYMLSMEEKYELREEGRESGREEGLREGLREGRSYGKEQGLMLKLINLVSKKMSRKQSAVQIAEELLEEPDMIETIYRTIRDHPEANEEEILQILGNCFSMAGE